MNCPFAGTFGFFLDRFIVPDIQAAVSMDEQQPPNKKSRFFAEGKQVLKSLLHRHGENNAADGSQQAPSTENASASRPRPSELDLGKANSLGTALSTRITPTANAFRELSFKERGDRRKAIYGASSLTRGGHGYNVGYGDPKECDDAEAVPDPNSDLPWQRGNIAQQSEQRQVSLLNASYDASKQSQFTFQAPAQPLLPRLPFQTAAPYQPGPGSKQMFANNVSQNGQNPQSEVQEPKVVRTPTATQNLQVPKQRVAGLPNDVTNPPPRPQTPLASTTTPVYPPINTARGFGPSWGVDTDRDAHGRRIQESYSGFTNLPAHAAVTRRAIVGSLPKPHPCVPDNALSSPDRVERAVQYAGIKRKRGAAVLPPPAYVYNRKDDPMFNIYHGILLYPELCFHVAAHLLLEDLISLYAICQDFHTIIDTRFTTVILSQANKKAPTSSHIFPFRSFRDLCRTDPAARIPHPDPEKAAQGVARHIPSFRWLRMILYREKTVHAIMAMFAERGIPIPRRCEQSIKKIWFLMDIPDNARRVGYIHNKQLVTDADLYFAVCFFVKLDMLLHDPTATMQFPHGRKFIMNQPSMSILLRLLTGEALTSRYDVIQEFVRWKYTAPEGQDIPDDESLFGVPKHEWGVMQKEYWANERPGWERAPSRPSEIMLLPDDLVKREAWKRGLRFSGHYLQFMQYGYVHPRTIENFERRALSRRIEEYEDDEYGLDDVVAGVRTMRVEDGGDRLLDLGKVARASTAVIKQEEPSKLEQQYRNEERGFIAQIYAESRQERQALGLQ